MNVIVIEFAHMLIPLFALSLSLSLSPLYISLSLVPNNNGPVDLDPLQSDELFHVKPSVQFTDPPTDRRSHIFAKNILPERQKVTTSRF